MGISSAIAAPGQERLDELKLYRRVAWRILPLTVVCYFFSYFDRINISFAKAQMQADLGLSDAAYGIAASIFFVGYVLFEVPSTIGLRKYGAPSWICRIMISWGLATAALMFASSEYVLYLLRFLIGVMEAGFGPAILFYLACWFPRRKMAAINGLFFLSGPISGALGAPVAGFILSHMDGVMGLAGWHWLFLMSGLPCVLLGLVTVWKLDRDISSARWLAAEEKAYLIEQLGDAKAAAKPAHGSVLKVLMSWEVLALGLIYFVVKVSAYGINFWMPDLIRRSGVEDLTTIGLLTGIPYAFAFVGMLIVTRYSDRKGNRRTPLWVSLTVASVGYFLACTYPEYPALFMSALILATAGSFVAIPVFWAIPQTKFNGLAIAAAIAAINSLGQLSGIVAPSAIGFINELSDNKYLGMLSIAPVCLVGALLVLKFVPRKI